MRPQSILDWRTAGCKNKKPPDFQEVFGGTKQSRTAVHGFADRCLATRPWYRFVVWTANVGLFSYFTKFISSHFFFSLQNVKWP